MRKIVTILSIIVTLSATLLNPILAGAAVSSFAIGDVDMDGIVSGHDTAMVSRYALDDTYRLTDDQLLLADVNADGTVNSTDADILYNDMQVYSLGDADMDGSISPDDASFILEYILAPNEALSQIQINLADVNLDENITINDSGAVLNICARNAAQLSDFEEASKYYDDIIHYIYGDADYNNEISLDDAAVILAIYAARAANISTDNYAKLQLILADADDDGIIGLNDAALVLQEYAEISANLK